MYIYNIIYIYIFHYIYNIIYNIYYIIYIYYYIISYIYIYIIMYYMHSSYHSIYGYVFLIYLQLDQCILSWIKVNIKQHTSPGWPHCGSWFEWPAVRNTCLRLRVRVTQVRCRKNLLICEFLTSGIVHCCSRSCSICQSSDNLDSDC